MMYHKICPASQSNRARDSHPFFIVEDGKVKDTDSSSNKNQLIVKFPGRNDVFKEHDMNTHKRSYRLHETKHNAATLFVNWPVDFPRSSSQPPALYNDRPEGTVDSVFSIVYERVKFNILSHLKSRKSASKPLEIILSGQSLGAHTALNIAVRLIDDPQLKSDVELKGVITTNAFKSISHTINAYSKKNIFLQSLFNLFKAPSYALLYTTEWNLNNEVLLAKLQRANIPLLVANCKNDKVIRSHAQLATSKELDPKLVSVLHIEYTNKGHSEHYLEKVTEFLDNQFSS